MSEMAKDKKKRFFSTRNIVSCAMLAACAIIMTYLEFPTPFAPGFYRFNLSDLPALIGAFSLGPVAGVIIELIKSLVMLFINPQNPSMGIGELANFVLGCIFVIPAALIYRRNKKKSRAIIGLLVGGVSMSVIAAFLNAYVMIPLYSAAFNMPVDSIIAMGHDIFPFVDSMFKFCLVCVLPFNLVKAFIVSVVTILIYKPLSVLIKGLN